jgi:hypothetical protein
MITLFNRTGVEILGSSSLSGKKNVTLIQPIVKIGSIIPADTKALLKKASDSARNSGHISAKREVLLDKIRQIGDLLKENDGIQVSAEVDKSIKHILKK